MKCFVANCFNYDDSRERNLSFFRFPKDPVRRQQWINIIPHLRGTPTERHILCSRHFAPEDISIGQTKSLLKRSAVPKYFNDCDTNTNNGIYVNYLRTYASKRRKKNIVNVEENDNAGNALLDISENSTESDSITIIDSDDSSSTSKPNSSEHDKYINYKISGLEFGDDSKVSLEPIEKDDCPMMICEQTGTSSETATYSILDQLSDNDEIKSNHKNNFGISSSNELKYKEKSLMNLMTRFYKLSCQLCPKKKILKKFTPLSTLLNHYKHVHSVDGFVECCDIKLSKFLEMSLHIAGHINPQTHQCPECDKIMDTLEELKTHIKDHIPYEYR